MEINDRTMPDFGNYVTTILYTVYDNDNESEVYCPYAEKNMHGSNDIKVGSQKCIECDCYSGRGEWKDNVYFVQCSFQARTEMRRRNSSRNNNRQCKKEIFYVLNTSTNQIKYEHHSFDSARKETNRLSGITPGITTFRILRVVAELKTTISKKWNLDL